MPEILVEEKRSKHGTTVARQPKGNHPRKKDTNPIKTVRAPKGVTIIGGAKVYAAKLATTRRHGVRDGATPRSIYSLPSPNTTDGRAEKMSSK